MESLFSAAAPQDYLQAPPMLVTNRNTGDPLAVEQSVAAVSQFRPMTTRDLQVVQRELTILTGRLEEVEQQLIKEKKMGEAANLLGKLHTDRRKSGIFTKSSKRLSRQADDEAKVSEDRVARLEFAKSELSARKLGLENRLLRHHAAVLCKSLGDEPLDPRPMSIILDAPERSPRRQSRRLSQFDFSDLDIPSIPSIPPLHSSHSRSASASQFSEDASTELVGIAKKIEGALPNITPNPNKSAFIQSAFDWLFREQQRSEKVIETLQDQTKQAEQRIVYLSSQQQGKQLPSTSPETAQIAAEKAQIAAEYENERKRSRELRDRLESQRQELTRVTKELEDVTRIAVENESQLRGYQQVVEQLEQHNEQQASQIASQAGDRLVSPAPSVLCKEFRQILHELSMQHYHTEKELRSQMLGGYRKS